MIDKPDDDPGITMDAIIAPHRERTLQRMTAQNEVLCIQDGSDLNYNSLSQCTGLGAISNNQTNTQSRGLHLHSTMVVSSDGIPLGLLGAKCEAREIKKQNEDTALNNGPIEEKKNFAG